MTTGAELIAGERWRQIADEGYTPDHDATHDPTDLSSAAIAYAIYARWQTDPLTGWTLNQVEDIVLENWWPWDERYWKPHHDPTHNLAKAGALIAAEIDRLAAS